jgi:citrate synthase
MRRINTYDELKAEKRRLKSHRAFLEAEIKKDFREIKEGLEPMNLLKKSTVHAVEKSDPHALGDSIGNFANMVARLALKRSGLLPRIIVPLVLRSVTSKLVEKNKARIIDWAGSLFNRLSYHRRTLTGKT